MIVGVPREAHGLEHRAGLTPFAVHRLSSLGHTVVVERGVGEDAHFSDADYQNAGAQILYSGEEILRRSDLLCCVGRLDREQASMLRPGATVCGFQHMAVAGPETVGPLRDREATLIGYELIGRLGGGSGPRSVQRDGRAHGPADRRPLPAER